MLFKLFWCLLWIAGGAQGSGAGVARYALERHVRSKQKESRAGLSGGRHGVDPQTTERGKPGRAARITSLNTVDERGARRKLSYAIIVGRASLQTAVTAWCKNKAAAALVYGNISSWDTSLVTDMSTLFSAPLGGVGSLGGYCSTYDTFNDDISSWDGKTM